MLLQPTQETEMELCGTPTDDGSTVTSIPEMGDKKAEVDSGLPDPVVSGGSDSGSLQANPVQVVKIYILTLK
jgi:hypothetical protein